jgi:hypothetical protein
MTPFSLLILRAGLSHREASDFHSVRLDTVKSWSSGRNRTPTNVLNDLSLLIRRQKVSAAEALNHIVDLAGKENCPDEIELGYPKDDFEAQTIGWPCVGAWKSMAARLIQESVIPIRLVPRGATTATTARQRNQLKRFGRIYGNQIAKVIA